MKNKAAIFVQTVREALLEIEVAILNAIQAYLKAEQLLQEISEAEKGN